MENLFIENFYGDISVREIDHTNEVLIKINGTAPNMIYLNREDLVKVRDYLTEQIEKKPFN